MEKDKNKFETRSIPHHLSNMGACIATSRSKSLVFTDELPADRNSRINSEVYKAILFAQVQPYFATYLPSYKCSI